MSANASSRYDQSLSQSVPSIHHETHIEGDMRGGNDPEGVTGSAPSNMAFFEMGEPSTRGRVGVLSLSWKALFYPLPRFLVRTVQSIITHYQRYAQEKRLQEDYLQSLYERFRERGIEEYPEGWLQFAAFLNSADNFAIFRIFGLVHCRVLVHLQAEIQLLEQQLSELDNSDSESGSPNLWRLQTAKYDESWDPAQREILKKLQDKLVIYDTLLLNDQNLRKLDRPSAGSHRSVFHWIMRKKPFHKGQYNWIYHAADFVPQSQVPPFESIIYASLLKPFFRSGSTVSNKATVHHYSFRRLSSFAKFITISLTVSILILPIFVLLWVPMSQASVISTVLLSVLGFSGIMLMTRAEVRHVFIGTATYCAVLATFLGNKSQTQGHVKIV